MNLTDLSTPRLLAFFHTLKDGPQPSGVYDGTAWSPEYPRTARLASTVWAGKVFTGFEVTNRLAGLQAARGRLVHSPGLCWVIDYPQLGLRDELRWADGYWLGRMRWKQGWIWFTLTPAGT